MEFKIANVKAAIKQTADGYTFELKRGRKTVAADSNYTRARDAKRGAVRAAKRAFGVSA